MTNNSINQTDSAPLLEVKNLGVSFFTPRGTVRAVRDASLTVRRGEVVGLVGESGCGKSTLLNIIAGLDKDYEGTVDFGD
ncbi:MAG TPA: ATP-binding cassette domain-containing protein, partial [Dehalococcoidia bacterium]|nr:ATP-binding cassette domain-containing protein [Dehalococcoidia bacterium]